MKKKKIELNNKLFIRKETIGALNDKQSGQVVGGWYTNVRETAEAPYFDPLCQSCPPPVETNNTCPGTGPIMSGITCIGVNC